MQEKYNVTGMTCAACSSRVQKSVSALPGVQDCNVNLLKNSMIVTYNDAAVNSSQIIGALRAVFADVQRHDAGRSHKKASLLKKKTACFHRPSHVILLYHPHPKGTRNHLQNPPVPAWKENAFPTVPVPAPGPPDVYPSLCFSTRTAVPLISTRAG